MYLVRDLGITPSQSKSQDMWHVAEKKVDNFSLSIPCLSLSIVKVPTIVNYQTASLIQLRKKKKGVSHQSGKMLHSAQFIFYYGLKG